jgi:tetratricopeptide (TPR) repeat protein
MAKDSINELQRKSLGLMKEGNLKKSLKTINLAIKSDKTVAINFYIQGRILQELMDFESSIIAYKKYLSLGKNYEGNDIYRKAKFNLSICYFTVRKFSEGSKLYRYRHEKTVVDAYASKLTWTENINSGRVLIWAEQGIGDEILFLRFLKFLEKFGCDFYLECDRRIHEIVSANFPKIHLIERGSKPELSYFDYQIPFGDLLSIFHQRLNEISQPYLTLPISKEALEIQDQFINKKLVGISWRSLNQDYKAERSKKLEELCIGLDPDRDVLVILQPKVLDEEIRQIKNKGFQTLNICDCFNDINAVFQLILICSNVNTIANSVAHFAGALGKKTMLWLPEYPTWRWGYNIDKSDLYPTIEFKKSLS